jgi:hypothetical protein
LAVAPNPTAFFQASTPITPCPGHQIPAFISGAADSGFSEPSISIASA